MTAATTPNSVYDFCIRNVWSLSAAVEYAFLFSMLPNTCNWKVFCSALRQKWNHKQLKDCGKKSTSRPKVLNTKYIGQLCAKWFSSDCVKCYVCTLEKSGKCLLDARVCAMMWLVVLGLQCTSWESVILRWWPLWETPSPLLTGRKPGPFSDVSPTTEVPPGGKHRVLIISLALDYTHNNGVYQTNR